MSWNACPAFTHLCLPLLGLLPLAAPQSSSPWLAPEKAAADFERFAGFVRESYAFFELKRTDWARVEAELRPRALAARDVVEWMHVLEDALDQLYDPHNMLNCNAPDSWRPVPYGVWVERRDGRDVVLGVQRGSGAEAAGVVPGDELLAIDGVTLEERVRARMPRFLGSADPQAEQWARASAVAGQHAAEMRLRLRRRDGSVVELRTDGEGRARALVEWSALPGNVGRIALSSFGDAQAVADFDAALEALRGTRALILDVRSNSGGDTAVARPILGRFLAARAQYAWMARREGAGLGPRWAEFVEPRGPWTYTAPVVVLVDRFSVSMAEGFAMALSSLGRARTVGTPMARLGAAIGRVHLPHSDISVQISTEPVYAPDGTPRWELVPDVAVDPLDVRGGDPFERAALALLGE
jgi:carboxyl-terminal processing protease